MKFTRTVCCSASLLPMNSIRLSLPFEGGVALVETPTATTCGIAAILERICSKYSLRSFHVE